MRGTVLSFGADGVPAAASTCSVNGHSKIYDVQLNVLHARVRTAWWYPTVCQLYVGTVGFQA